MTAVSPFDRTSIQPLAELVGAASRVSLVIGPDGRISHAAGAPWPLLGLTSEVALGRLATDIVAAEDHELLTELLGAEGSGLGEIELRFSNPSSPHSFEPLLQVSAAALPGMPGAVLLSAVDPHSGRAIDAALRNSGRVSAALAARSPLVVFHLDAEGRMTAINAPWHTLTGQSASEALDLGWLLRVHEDDRAGLFDVANAAHQATRGWRHQVRVEHVAFGFSVCDVAAAPIMPDGTLHGYVGVFVAHERPRTDLPLAPAPLFGRAAELTPSSPRDADSADVADAADLRAAAKVAEAAILVTDFAPSTPELAPSGRSMSGPSAAEGTAASLMEIVPPTPISSAVSPNLVSDYANAANSASSLGSAGLRIGVASPPRFVAEPSPGLSAPVEFLVGRDEHADDDRAEDVLDTATHEDLDELVQPGFVPPPLALELRRPAPLEDTRPLPVGQLDSYRGPLAAVVEYHPPVAVPFESAGPLGEHGSAGAGVATPVAPPPPMPQAASTASVPAVVDYHPTLAAPPTAPASVPAVVDYHPTLAAPPTAPASVPAVVDYHPTLAAPPTAPASVPAVVDHHPTFAPSPTAVAVPVVSPVPTVEHSSAAADADAAAIGWAAPPSASRAPADVQAVAAAASWLPETPYLDHAANPADGGSVPAVFDFHPTTAEAIWAAEPHPSTPGVDAPASFDFQPAPISPSWAPQAPAAPTERPGVGLARLDDDDPARETSPSTSSSASGYLRAEQATGALPLDEILARQAQDPTRPDPTWFEPIVPGVADMHGGATAAEPVGPFPGAFSDSQPFFDDSELFSGAGPSGAPTWTPPPTAPAAGIQHETPNAAYQPTNSSFGSMASGAAFDPNPVPGADELTGLANRTLFHLLVDDALLRLREEGISVAVFTFDLIGFRELATAAGPKSADDYFFILAKRIESTIRGVDTAGRVGEHDMAVLVVGWFFPGDLENIARRFIRKLVEPLPTRSGEAVNIGACLGGALAEQTDDANALMRRSFEARAISRSLGSGRGNINFGSHQTVVEL